MHITIEQNQVIVHLDEAEVPAFSAMFDTLHDKIGVSVEFRDFDFGDMTALRTLLPIHLCRTIGEANLSENPFATMSLYPFWKYGFAFGGESALALDLKIEDPHKKAVAADEFGMGFCAWAMEEIFDCDYWADASSLIEQGMVVPSGSKRPDFVCGFADGSLGIFEAKGTTGTSGNLSGALAEGKKQAASLTALDPISQRVVVGAALGGEFAKVILLDPPGCDDAKPTNLSSDMVKRAARKMRRTIPLDETIFRGPGMEITLKHETLRKGKNHGWLETKGESAEGG